MKILKVSFLHYPLHFKVEAKTSRNTLKVKDSWIVVCKSNSGTIGYGECAPIWGLSPENREELELKMLELSASSDPEAIDLKHYPTLKFGLETAIKDLSTDNHILFDSEFSSGKTGIPINGLVWMGDIAFMKNQIGKKLDAGFSCLKLKVGAQNLEDELGILKEIRREFSADRLEIRLDANGAFASHEVLTTLDRFAKFTIHSIEQPIQPGNWNQMAEVCASSPMPVALDEELIGVYEPARRKLLLDTIDPQYIILKPSLLGGLAACDEWVDLAASNDIGWWATSMLESNIGLNAIAQWVSTKNTEMKQGLGTGKLYSNNIPSPLEIRGEELWLGNQAWNIETALNESNT